MRDARLVLLAVSLLVGCESLSKPKVDDPVFSKPPPRRPVPDRQPAESAVLPEQPHAASVDDDNPFKIIRPLAGVDHGQAAVEPDQPEVVATVNGSPIFASEVLDRYGMQLAQARQQVSPEEYRKLRSALIKRDLEGHIERRLLVSALRSTLKPQQSEMVDKQLDKGFEAEIARLKRELNVNTKHELEIEVNKQGTSLANLRNAFANQRLAREYLALKSKNGQKIGRQELVNYYQNNLDDYAIAGAVKWQQIVISRTGPGGDQAASKKLDQAIDDLKRDVDFANVARQYTFSHRQTRFCVGFIEKTGL